MKRRGGAWAISNRLCEVITARTCLALPTFDGGAKARVRRRVAPTKMMVLLFPFQQH